MARNKVEPVWMPHAAHFICGSDCRFHLATYVNGYIVSTVGEYWPDSRVRKINAAVRNIAITGNGDEWDADYRRKIGYHDIGADRKYETMVFKANRSRNTCCPFELANSSNVDFAGYNEAGAAFRGHMKILAKWTVKNTRHGS